MRSFFLTLWLASFSVFWVSSVEAGGKKQPFIFRVYTQRVSPAPGEKVQTITLFNPQQNIYVSKYADLGEKHISNYRVRVDGYVEILFDKTGKRLLETATSNNIGRILVVVVNDRVIYAPKIDVPMRQGRLLIPASFSPEEQAALDKILKKKNRG